MAVLAASWVLAVTLRPASTVRTINLVPLRDHIWAVRCVLSGCPALGSAVYTIAVNGLGNMVVFFPIGLALVGALENLRAGQRLRTAIVIGAALSVSIELIQLTIPTRATDVDDVIFNTIGTAIGAAFMVVAQRWLKRNGEQT